MKARNGNGKSGGTNREHAAETASEAGAEPPASDRTDEQNGEQTQVDMDSTAQENADNPIAPLNFDYLGQEVRTVLIGEDAWFVAADVCAILQHTDVSSAVSRLDDEEKGTATVRTLGGPQEQKVVSESGLYNLVLTSRKPEAKAFRRWITGEVIPSIRRTGSYTMTGGRPLDEQIPAGAKAPPLGFGEAILFQRVTMEARAMASMLLTISAFSDMVEQMRELGGNPDDGHAASKLETTIASGLDMARHWLENDQRELARAKPHIKH